MEDCDRTTGCVAVICQGSILEVLKNEASGNSRNGLSLIVGVFILPVTLAVSDPLELLFVGVITLIAAMIIPVFVIMFIRGGVTLVADLTPLVLDNCALSSLCLPSFVRQLTGTPAASKKCSQLPLVIKAPGPFACWLSSHVINVIPDFVCCRGLVHCHHSCS